MIGTYVLFLESKRGLEMEAGKLGRISVPKGLYAYVGSAMGKSASLENRVGRHKKLAETKKGSRKWHIDYFTTSPRVEITGVVKVIGRGIECEVAKLLEESGGKIVKKKFGSTDCECGTHFFRVTEKVAEDFLRRLPDLF